MVTKRLSVPLSAVLVTVALWVVPAVAADHKHELKVGKTGEVSFGTETKVGSLTLKPGRYKLQHRVQGEDHFLHFTEMTKSQPHYPMSSSSEKSHAREVKCELEMTEKKASLTSIRLAKEGDGTMRVVRVEIAGENAAHVLKP